MLFWHHFAKSVQNIGGGAKPYSRPLSKYCKKCRYISLINLSVNRYAIPAYNRVCEIILSFAGHFFQRTMGSLLDILRFRRTFHVRQKSYFFARHFPQFLLAEDFVRREFTPLPDI